MEVFVGKEVYPVMAVVDTESELNIITEDAEIKASLPNRKLNINLRGIGVHTTSLIGLAEFTQVLLLYGEENNSFIHCQGSSTYCPWKALLASNNVRLDFSQQQGEIFSYQEADGRRSCMLICKPHIKLKFKEAEDKSKANIRRIYKSTQNKDYQKIKSMECNLDERFSIMGRGIETEYQEEVEGDQEVETQEQEQGLSTEALSNQIKPEELKSLAWYLDKEIKENKEWATFDHKTWEEWISRILPP
ncbi:hypothetical protein O181_094686 [Austropuccinia psidii MF-1]|uniref:Peptidase A2 domain-containing protein n=1 Tax=Austropuccinia psidii MF-1 TaxID=1389203 RepID=A0A9Q3J3Z5_9BASI|nr:hypothetical protein [Austropuccinia psidii MF-1]